jgi:hypothetical protein
VGLALNGALQLLAYADDVNLLGDNIDTIDKNAEAYRTRFCMGVKPGLSR